MSADEQGEVSGRAAPKYKGPAFDGTPAGFMKAKVAIEALMGALATSFATAVVVVPRRSQKHDGFSVQDAIAYISGTTLLDKQGKEVKLDLSELNQAKAFLRTTRVDGQASVASGSLMDTLRKCLEVVDAARASSTLRQEKAASKRLESRKASRREARRAAQNTLAHSHASSSSSSDDDDEGGGQARQRAPDHVNDVNDEYWGVRFGHNGHQVLTSWHGAGQVEEAVKGKKKDDDGNRVDFKKFLGVTAFQKHI